MDVIHQVVLHGMRAMQVSRPMPWSSSISVLVRMVILFTSIIDARTVGAANCVGHSVVHVAVVNMYADILHFGPSPCTAASPLPRMPTMPLLDLVMRVESGSSSISVVALGNWSRL